MKLLPHLCLCIHTTQLCCMLYGDIIQSQSQVTPIVVPDSTHCHCNWFGYLIPTKPKLNKSLTCFWIMTLPLSGGLMQLLLCVCPRCWINVVEHHDWFWWSTACTDDEFGCISSGSRLILESDDEHKSVLGDKERSVWRIL